MLEELYVVLEINRAGLFRSLGHYSREGARFFPVIVGEVGAKLEVDTAAARWNGCRTFKAFPLNSAEAFLAIPLFLVLPTVGTNLWKCKSSVSGLLWNRSCGTWDILTTRILR